MGTSQLVWRTVKCQVWDTDTMGYWVEKVKKMGFSGIRTWHLWQHGQKMAHRSNTNTKQTLGWPQRREILTWYTVLIVFSHMYIYETNSQNPKFPTMNSRKKMAPFLSIRYSYCTVYYNTRAAEMDNVHTVSPPILLWKSGSRNSYRPAGLKYLAEAKFKYLQHFAFEFSAFNRKIRAIQHNNIKFESVETVEDTSRRLYAPK